MRRVQFVIDEYNIKGWNQQDTLKGVANSINDDVSEDEDQDLLLVVKHRLSVLDDLHVGVELVDTDLLDNYFGGPHHQVTLTELAALSYQVKEPPKKDSSFRGVCQEWVRGIAVSQVSDDIKDS